jgi:hypothetical protein
VRGEGRGQRFPRKKYPAGIISVGSLGINNSLIRMENKNFKRLISMVEERGDFEEVLGRVNELYLVKIYKITELTSANIVELYQILQKKYFPWRP